MIAEFADLRQSNTVSLAYVSVTCKRIFSLSEKEHFFATNNWTNPKY
nr:MAG TPA: hypothetical protein [Caudoviricetes sp.]